MVSIALRLSTYRSLKTFRLTIRFEQAFQLFPGNGYHSTVTRMEVHTHSMVYYFKVFEVDTFRKLVFTFHIYIVHQDIFVRPYQRENTRTFYGFFGLLFIIIRFLPLSGSQRRSGRLFDSISIAFRFIEQMVKSVL